MLGMLFSLLAFMLVGCLSTDGSAKRDSGVTLKAKDVSFKSEPGPLAVTNNTKKDVVIFAGSVSRNAVLGGVKAGQRRTFNLSKLPGIPKNGSLLVRAATYDAYKGKAKVTDDDVIYTALAVYDLSDPKDTDELTIYKGVDTAQEYCVYLTNNSERFVVDVRLDKPNGQVIATLAPLENEKCVFLTPKAQGTPYRFYPQFVYVDPSTKEKTSLNVKGKASVQTMDPDPVGGTFTPITFEEPSDYEDKYSLAFVTIRNDTGAGMEVRNVKTPLANQRGRKFTASGRSDVYELDTGTAKTGRKYTGLTCVFNAFTEKRIDDYTFKPGYVYEIVWTSKNGNYQYDIKELDQKSIVEDVRIDLFLED